MNTLEIDEYASKNHVTKKFYKGCFASDNLHTLGKIADKDLPALIVANLCPASRTDIFCHWIAISVSKKCVEVFDSGGINSFSSNTNVNEFLKQQNKKVACNKLQVQSYTSDRCGILVLCFIYAKAVSISFKDFLNMFNKKNLDTNDAIGDRIFKCSFLSEKAKHCFKKIKKKL